MMPTPVVGMEKQRALVTGSRGFIGSHLVRRLRESGWEVHELLRPRTEESGSLGADASQVHAYFGSTDEVVGAVRIAKPHVVFHLASLFLAQHIPEQIVPLVESNITLGTQLLEAMKLTGTKRLVNTGTSWQHFQGDSYNPVNLYAATKQAFEDILKYYEETAGIQAITLSLFDSYGPGDTRKKLLHLLLDALRDGQVLEMSGGEQKIDLAHVDDLCAAFVHAAGLAEEPAAPGSRVYGVSGGDRMTLREVVETLERAAGRKISIRWGARPYREREVMQLWNGPELPGWRPKVRLYDGFRALVQENRPPM